MSRIKNIKLTSPDDNNEILFPQTSLDQVVDKNDGYPIDKKFYEMSLKTKRLFDSYQNNKFFTSFKELGLVDGEETLKDIAINLPAYSTFHFNKNRGNGNDSIYPDSKGLLTVVKLNNHTRVSFRFENIESFYYGFLNYSGIDESSTIDDYFSGWKNLSSASGIYTSLESIGLNEGSESIDDIVNHLPTQSSLNVEIYSSYGNLSIYPANTGQLTVKKGLRLTQVSFTFHTYNEFYIAYYNKHSDPLFSGWEKLGLESS